MNETRPPSPPTPSSEQSGTTTLGSLGRVPKSSPRLAACGDVEEAGAAIDAAISTRGVPGRVDSLLRSVRADLSCLRADLAMSHEPETPEPVRISPEAIARAESVHDDYRSQAQEPESISPNEMSSSAGLLRLARAVTRRAERSVWTLVADEPEAISRCVPVYLDRLGDLLRDIATDLDRNDRDDIPVGFCYDPEPLDTWDR